MLHVLKVCADFMSHPYHNKSKVGRNILLIKLLKLFITNTSSKDGFEIDTIH